MLGREIFYDCIRANIQHEMSEHVDWYRDHVPGGRIYDDDGWRDYWTTLCNAASPTRGFHVGRDKYLEGIHILAIANVLKRPILLLDANMGDTTDPLIQSQRDEDNANMRGSGMYV